MNQVDAAGKSTYPAQTEFGTLPRVGPIAV
jgi:hypothetical protein